MMEENIDLTALGEQEFSPRTLAKGEALLGSGEISFSEPQVAKITGSSGDVYTLTWMEDGNSLIGVTCNCPNGQNKAIPNCYHAAALWLKWEKDRGIK